MQERTSRAPWLRRLGPSGFRSCAKCSDDSLGCSANRRQALPLALASDIGGGLVFRSFRIPKMAAPQPAARFCLQKWAASQPPLVLRAEMGGTLACRRFFPTTALRFGWRNKKSVPTSFRFTSRQRST